MLVLVVCGGGIATGISELIMRGSIVSGYVQAERAYIRVSLEIITSCTPSILRVTAESLGRFAVSPADGRAERRKIRGRYNCSKYHT